jgi:hypothetical protein
LRGIPPLLAGDCRAGCFLGILKAITVVLLFASVPLFVAIFFVKAIAFYTSSLRGGNEEAISIIQFSKKVFPLQSGLENFGLQSY